MARSNFRSEVIQVLFHQIRATVCFFAAGLGLHGVGELEEFGVEVVDGVERVVGVAVVAEGVGCVEQGAVQVTADQQASGDADGAERVEAVCVLDYPGFQAAGWDVGAEAVGLDGVVNPGQQLCRGSLFQSENRWLRLRRVSNPAP